MEASSSLPGSLGQQKRAGDASAVSDAPHSKCAGRFRAAGARPIQLFEGSRPWGLLCIFNRVGVLREVWRIATGTGKSEGRTGLVVLCVW